MNQLLRKIPLSALLLFVFLLNNSQNVFCAESNICQNIDAVVALDGSGDFSSIQTAIDSAPDSLKKSYRIFIKNGIYKEKIFVNKSFITLIGEDRDSTWIIYPELRKNWRALNNDSDWGSAVINIADDVTDLTFANLSIYNNYGSLYDDHDHQFTIRGGGTKVVIVNCFIKSDGGDALSLWNSSNGYYYHAYCKFEGWVDFVCPRGWCYIIDSEFYSYSKTASIWHDGSFDKDQKFVIRNSFFDGIPGFALGRNHRDGQFFLIDCTFSDSLADKPIFIVRYDDTTRNKPIFWGERYYYNNCRKKGREYSWYDDNLHLYDERLKVDDITSSWTFNNKWAPEQNLDEIIPFASFPSLEKIPGDNNSEDVLLKWKSGRHAISHNFYLGETPEVSFVTNTNEVAISLKDIEPNKTYYWRVDEVTSHKIVKGKLWKFIKPASNE